MEGLITKYRRRSLAKITSGLSNELSPIAFIAFGSGGTDEAGNVKTPTEIQEELFHEEKRYRIDDKEIINETTVRYTVTIPGADLVDVAINEIALVDEAGKICAIKTFRNKIKDEHLPLTFQFDDEY